MSHTKNKLFAAAFWILRPLALFLMRQGMSHKEFSELAKRAFVEAAFADLAIEGRKPTVARAAVLTGLSRKEAMRVMLEPDLGDQQDFAAPNRAVRVINGWMADHEFLDEEGRPRELAISGDGPNFHVLVKRYSGDISAGAILDELVRVGAVEKVRGHRIRLCAEGYVPEKGAEERIEILGVCGADLLHTLNHNISAPTDARFFQRQVVYHRLPRASADAFKQVSRAKSEKLLRELNAWLAAEKGRVATLPSEGPTWRIGVGAYYFENKEKQNEVPYAKN